MDEYMDRGSAYGMGDFKAVGIKDITTLRSLGGTCASTRIRNTPHNMQNDDRAVQEDSGE